MNSNSYIEISYGKHDIEGDRVVVSYTRAKKGDNLIIPLNNTEGGNWNTDSIRDFLTIIVQEENIVDGEKSILGLRKDETIQKMLENKQNRTVAFIVNLFEIFVNSFNAD
ncbi:hypothetical protein NXS15_00565 [Mycoplasma sp. CSL7475-4]|uniref:hypothetical protein n=1 Tax=Mycoplasma sp. CSL7475-4 TaxID=2973942 RepID=UPI00216B20A5|nr:hypothetical protein [Mycoplasma sp. CSL7475-4]MCS4536625.1 hypothetical protein [Mycoplasma sp. CSL7475-4]